MSALRAKNRLIARERPFAKRAFRISLRLPEITEKNATIPVNAQSEQGRPRQNFRKIRKLDLD